MTQALEGVRKFVVSHEAAYKLRWGTAVLVRSLIQRSLVDEFVLMIDPLVLGTERRFLRRRFVHQARARRYHHDRHGVIVASYAR
jgi:dihydrofolate reductase